MIVPSNRRWNDIELLSAFVSDPSSSRTNDDTPSSGDDVKEKSCADCGIACLRTVIVPQFVTRTSIGRMKSFRLDVNESDERLLT